MDFEDTIQVHSDLGIVKQRHATFDMKQQEAAQFGVAAVTEYAKTVKATSSKTAYLG